MHKNRAKLLSNGSLILHDNARPYVANVVTEKLLEYGWKVLPHPPYRPDLSPPDFDLFPKLKKPMRGCRYSSLQELSAASTQVIRQMNKDYVLDGTVKLPNRWDSVIEKHGDYIEGLLSAIRKKMHFNSVHYFLNNSRSSKQSFTILQNIGRRKVDHVIR